MSATIADVSIQSTQDPNTKAYHTRFELAEAVESGVRGDSTGLGEFGNMILEMRGVVQVQVSSYLILVTKAPLFNWEEIENSVTDLLKIFAISMRQLENVPLPTFGPVDRVEPARPASPRVRRKAKAVDSDLQSEAPRN